MNILADKRSALKAGDDQLAHQISEGEDIMSILRTFDFFHHYHTRY